MSVTDALFEHAEQKLVGLARILPPWDEATSVELELSVERTPRSSAPQIAEVTVRTKGPVLRVRESAEDMYVGHRPGRAQAGAPGPALPRPAQGPRAARLPGRRPRRAAPERAEEAAAEEPRRAS